MTKDDLKLLSENTFYDNDNGEIEPRGHRAFNNKMIDAMAMEEDFTRDGDGSKFLADDGSYKIIEDIDLTAIESDVISKMSNIHSLGSEERPFKSVFARRINGVAVARGKGYTNFLSGDGEYRELNNGWQEIRENEPLARNIAEIDWCVIGDALLLKGDLSSGEAMATSLRITLPEIYLERIKDDTFSYVADTSFTNGTSYNRYLITVRKEIGYLRIAPDYNGALMPVSTLAFHFTLLVIPLIPEDIKGDVVGEQTGTDYSEWDYSQIETKNYRTREVYPYIQDIYSNGSLGEKKYGETGTETDLVTNWYSYPLLDATNKRSSQRKRFIFGDGDFYCLDNGLWNNGLELYMGPSEGGSPTEVPFTGGVRELTDPDVYPLFIGTATGSNRLLLGNPDIEVQEIKYGSTAIITPVPTLSPAGSDPVTSIPSLLGELPVFVTPDPANKRLIISDYRALPSKNRSYPLEVKVLLSETTQYDENGKVELEIVGTGSYLAIQNKSLSADSDYWRIAFKENSYTAFEIVTKDFYKNVGYPFSDGGTFNGEMGFGPNAVFGVKLSAGGSATYSYNQEVPGVTFKNYIVSEGSWIRMASIIESSGITYVGTEKFTCYATANTSLISRSATIEFRAVTNYGDLSEVLLTDIVRQTGSGILPIG